MTANTLQRVTEEVAAAIGATVDYVPEYELKDFQEEKLLVLPTGLAFEPATRGALKVTVSLEIGIAKRIQPGDLPGMLEHVEALTRQLLDMEVLDGCGTCTGVINPSAYDVEAMVRESMFISVLQAEFEIDGYERD